MSTPSEARKPRQIVVPTDVPLGSYHGGDVIVPITEPHNMVRNGVPFRSTDAARWAYRRRHENGLAEAFRVVNGKICLDVGKFHELVRQGRAA